MATRIGSNYNLVLIEQNIRKAREAHFKAMEPLATGRRLNHLRDDPSKIAEFFRLQNNIVRKEQYQLNINTARTRVNLTDSILSELTELTNQVYELAVQSNDETLSATQVTSITDRMNDLYDDIVDLSNTKIGNTYLFSGFATDTPPFSATGNPPPAAPMQFDGNTSTQEIKVSSTRTVQVGLNGDFYFTGDSQGTNSTVDAFDAIQTLMTNITNRDTAAIGTSITDIQTVLTQFNSARAVMGNSMQQLDAAENFISTLELADSERISALVETDIAKATSDLSYSEYVLETAFAASKRVMEISLQSFLG